ncbi:hypothetical protein M9H77_30329 [Catharanthus roseus]|uniref:Uncharacterized protein n=1 Tax=Catharanthus roseus TaxID=4058 RepID=A0ACB9ZWZ0_CATRO|nr:hypothetical protein M9H77_30329 [Catharanthus roseus]
MERFQSFSLHGFEKLFIKMAEQDFKQDMDEYSLLSRPAYRTRGHDKDHQRSSGGIRPTNVESSQPGRGREEQRDPVIPKPRGKSKDLTTSFESRLTRVEEGMGAVDAHMENLDQRVEGLEADIAETHEEVREALTKLGESNRVYLQALRDEFMAEVARLRDAHQRELNSLLMQL